LSSDRYRIEFRTTSKFKANTILLLKELYDLDLRPDRNLSSYVLDAICEKQERDLDKIRDAREGLRAGQA